MLLGKISQRSAPAAVSGNQKGPPSTLDGFGNTVRSCKINWHVGIIAVRETPGNISPADREYFAVKKVEK